MNEGGNPLATIFGFWMLMQLASTLALILGGIYALYCLGRAASGLNRLAAAVEDLVARQSGATPGTAAGMGTTPGVGATAGAAPGSPMPGGAASDVMPSATPPFTPPVAPIPAAASVPAAATTAETETGDERR